MSEIPDSAPIFEEPSRREYTGYCVHAAYTVNNELRRITCNACKGVLDPMDLIVRQSNRTEVLIQLEREIVTQRKKLTAILEDEKRAKARTRNAKKKDADAAVEKALFNAKQDHERAIYGLMGARSAITAALKKLGHDDDEDGEGWKTR